MKGFIGRWGEMLLVASLIVAFNQHAVASTIFTEADSGRSVTVPLGERIYFDLNSNPSTGYSWRSTPIIGESVILSGTATFIPDNPDLAGSSGVYRIPLLASTLGQTFFEYHYQKGLSSQTMIKTFAISINVTPAPPRLTFTGSETGLVLSWPVADSEGYYLEGTPSLMAPQWQALNALVRSDGTNYWVEVQPTGNATYYRLRK